MAVNPFTQAKPYLWNGHGEKQEQQRFLCHALGRAYEAGKVRPILCGRAEVMIHNRLGGYVSVEGWLANELGLTLSVMTPENVQAYRLRWLEDLEQRWNQGERT